MEKKTNTAKEYTIYNTPLEWPKTIWKVYLWQGVCWCSTGHINWFNRAMMRLVFGWRFKKE